MTVESRYVLIVDDDADFVATVRPVLEEGGYEVDVAYSGEECLSKVKVRRPDLILLDIMMSSWSEGFEVADVLSESEEGRDIAIVLVSSMNLSSDLEPRPGLSSTLPVDACLTKPVEAENLLGQVERSLRRRAALREVAETESRGPGPLIMLVDDDVDFLDATTALLESNGYRVVRSFDAAGAREKIEEVTPDLIITDLMMESLLAGFMFSRQIRQVPRLRNIPIVFVTGIRTQGGFKFAWSETQLGVAGIDAYFEKPVPASELLDTVGRLLGRRRENHDKK
jgi:CheY-like chemotaxis protein